MVNGTPGDDAVVPKNDGLTIFGLGGDDVLPSDFKQTTLDGGADDDTLRIAFADTLAAGPSLPFAFLSDLVGSPGNDQLITDVSVDGMNVGSSAIVNANSQEGVGDDQINASFALTGLGGSAENYVDAGNGTHDVVAIARIGQSKGLQSQATNVLSGGTGSDTLLGCGYSEEGVLVEMFDVIWGTISWRLST